MSGSPLPLQKMRGSWNPGMSGNVDQAPSHFSAGVGGMETIFGGVEQCRPPAAPTIVKTSRVQSFSPGRRPSLLWPV